jgi:hypothetical protein
MVWKKGKWLSCEFLFQERYRQTGEGQGPTRSQQEGGSWSRQFAVHLFLHDAELRGNVSYSNLPDLPFNLKLEFFFFPFL